MVDETSAYIQWLDKEASHAPARRQRFVLSSHSHKIRARLVKLDLGAPAIRDEQAPLDLGAVAQARIVQDQRHYDTLGLALDAALDQCAGRGDFSLGDFIAEVRRGFSGAATREVYFLLLQHCACHARTVFVESTRNRLILANGRFTQSSREALVPALAPFDTFLAHLVGSLEFHQARGLPDEDRLERETGMNWQDQGTLVAALLDCGLLGLEDAPGELPHYYLESDFEWTGRYALFSRAHAAWVAKQRQAPRADAGLDPIEDFEGEFAGDASDDEYGVLSGDQLPEILEDSEDSIDFAGIDKALRESASSDYIGAWQSHRAARLTERSRAQRERDRIDELLAKLLGVLARGQAFDEPDGPALIRYIAETTDTPRAVVKAALGSGAQSGYPKVFQVTRTQTGGHGLEINPSLAWGMLAGYPRAQSACNRLLGDAAT